MAIAQTKPLGQYLNPLGSLMKPVSPLEASQSFKGMSKAKSQQVASEPYNYLTAPSPFTKENAPTITGALTGAGTTREIKTPLPIAQSPAKTAVASMKGRRNIPTEKKDTSVIPLVSAGESLNTDIAQQAISDIHAGMPMDQFDTVYPELAQNRGLFEQYEMDVKAGMPQEEGAKMYPELFGQDTTPTAPTEVPKEKGFLGRIGEQLGKRGEAIMEEGTKRVGFEPALRVGGQIAGGVGDIIGESIITGIKAITPDFVKEGAEEGAKAVLSTQVGQAGVNALQSGMESYKQWAKENPNASKDLEAVVNIASLVPIGKGAQVTGKGISKVGEKVVSPIVKPITTKAGLSLKKSAESAVSQALAPTKQALKAKTEKIAPEFIKKGIIGSRERIAEIAEKGLQESGAKMDELLGAGTLKGKVVKTEPLIKKLAEIERSGIVAGKIADVDKIKNVRSMLDEVSQFGDEISAEQARNLRQAWDGIINRKGGFNATAAEKLDVDIRKSMANVLRGELAKASPDLAKVNKDFSFYSNLSEIINETLQRTKPQSGKLEKLASMGSAVITGTATANPLTAAGAYVATKGFIDFITGSTYKTLSAQAKNKLADMLLGGKVDTVKNILKTGKNDGNTIGRAILSVPLQQDKIKTINPLDLSKNKKGFISPKAIGESIGIGKKVPDELKGLAEEAKKYKSADEFVKNKPEGVFIRGEGNNIGVTSLARGIYASNKGDVASHYGSNISAFKAKDGAKVYAEDLPQSVLNKANEFAEKSVDFDKDTVAWTNKRGEYITNYLKEKGYDAIYHNIAGRKDIVILNPDMFEKLDLNKFYNSVKVK